MESSANPPDERALLTTKRNNLRWIEPNMATAILSSEPELPSRGSVEPLHVVFAGGGTGGHLFPGLAVAEQLDRADRPVRVTFVGSGNEFERAAVARAGREYLPVRCRPLPASPLEAMRFLCDNFSGYREASRYLRQENVAVVVGLGGYASVPMARAALKHEVPLLLLEQNAVPGRATSWLSPSAAAVCAAFPQVRSALNLDETLRVTGNPLRREFSRLSQPVGPCRATKSKDEPFRLIVLGGSSGAETLNGQVPRALYKLRGRLKGWQIVHQTGPRGWEATRELYRKFGLRAVVVPFIEQMAHMLAGSDLAISRAGGTVLAELAVTGVPAVLVPYPHATDDHQRKNADLFTTAGACVTVDARDLTCRLDDRLAAVLNELVLDTLRRKRMGEIMRGFARPRAAEQVARLVLEAAHTGALQAAG
jgi:UDP-N-acetylglucosamine--N-acetylmuramyl-(pentapeptide) pyrophosphoryl-undecaprenol N-acetylglucosamine transferase